MKKETFKSYEELPLMLSVPEMAAALGISRLLDEPERKLLLKMADLEDALREEACLNSFISGYRLAQGIQQELLADQPPYNFENEDEQRACELAGKER